MQTAVGRLAQRHHRVGGPIHSGQCVNVSVAVLSRPPAACRSGTGASKKASALFWSAPRRLWSTAWWTSSNRLASGDKQLRGAVCQAGVSGSPHGGFLLHLAAGTQQSDFNLSKNHCSPRQRCGAGLLAPVQLLLSWRGPRLSSRYGVHQHPAFRAWRTPGSGVHVMPVPQCPSTRLSSFDVVCRSYVRSTASPRLPVPASLLTRLTELASTSAVTPCPLL